MSQLLDEEKKIFDDLLHKIVDHKNKIGKRGINYCVLGTYQDFCTFRRTIFVELEERLKRSWGEKAKGFEYRKIKGQDMLCFSYELSLRTSWEKSIRW